MFVFKTIAYTYRDTRKTAKTIAEISAPGNNQRLHDECHSL